MNTKQLRQKILDLAIRGKLVPQDPNDEPASVLLERIRAEKERLIKEKKIKADKKKSGAKSHYENFFKIPDSWTWVELGDIGTWQSGSTPSRAKKEYFDGDILWLKTGDLNDSYIYEIPEKITQKALFASSLKINPIGSILIAMYGATIGKVGILTQPATTNQACCACSDFKGIYNLYLFYLLIAYREYFIQLGEGGAQPNISKIKITSTYIPLPPLSEQYRIVTEIERLFSLVDIIEDNTLSLVQLFTQTKSKVLDLAIRGKLVPQGPSDEPVSVLLEQIGRRQKTKKSISDKFPYPFEVPESWEWCKLGEIGDWQSGSTPSRAKKEYYNGDINWLKTGDLTDDYIYNISEKITQKALLETSVKLNPIGSVLIAMYGATIGKVGILTQPATTNQACCACSNFRGINNLYLFYLLIAYRDYFIQLGEGGAQPNISKEKIISTDIPLPPLSEQQRIVEKIEEIFKMLDKIEENIQTNA